MANETEPQKYGKCLIEREIGRGARSIVYLAWHEGLQIPVAVKVMKKDEEGDDEQFAERFMREARIAAQLTHSNIVRVYDCGETVESYYLVLEYIEGESCKDRMIRRGAFDWEEAAAIVRGVADGLNYAAKKGVIHRDLKPENIMIDNNGNPRIADLGLAKEVTPGQASATAQGDVLGTPYYMSPEQVRQPAKVDLRSDIYSVGATLYHMVTAEVPFEAPTPFEIMAMHLNEPLLPPQERRADLPKAICDIIVRAMAKDPQERYPTYEELLRDLDILLVGHPTATETSAAPSPGGAPTQQAPPQQPVPAAAEAPEPTRKTPSQLRPIKVHALPITAHNVQAKWLGMLALVAFAFLAVCLHHIVRGWAGPVAATGALAALLAAAAAAAYVVVQRGTTREEIDPSDTVDRRLSAALGWVCERLYLPTPRMYVSRRADEQCHSYTFFRRKATLHIPGGWLLKAGLSDDEMKAFLAHSLAGAYNGDSDLRTLLALPLGLLHAGGRIGRKLIDLPRSAGSRARLGIAHGLAMAGMALICGAVAVLFLLSVWAGLLGLMLFALLLLAASFERHSVYGADEFAVRVVENEEVVAVMVVTAGLTSPERYRLIWETMGPEVADRNADDLPPQARGELSQCIAAHFGEVAHSPDMLEMARKLLSGLPPAADRLNRLAGLAGPGLVVPAIGAARRFYATLLGTDREGPLSVVDLSAVGLYAAMGLVGGLVTVLVLAFVFLRSGGSYGEFLAVLGAFAAVLGFAVVARSGAEGLSAGRAGWAMVVASVLFTTTAMLGFCLTGWTRLSRLALQFPVFLLLVMPLAGLAGVLLVRVGPKLGMRIRTGSPDVRSRTAHTVMVSTKREEESVLSSRRDGGGRGGKRDETG
ncbi:MAG: serine/threonine-protein kinase [Planctomycetota bacterium]|jgi:serine/threonine-protein kinase